MNTKKIDGYKIKQYYKEFKDFIESTASLPQIKPIKIYYDGNILAYVDLNEIKQEEIPLYYTDELVKQPIQCVKSKIFHKFTHIYDANIQFANMSSNSLSDIMNTYSEFHASQDLRGFESIEVKLKKPKTPPKSRASDLPKKLPSGLEPPTSALPRRRSTD